MKPGKKLPGNQLKGATAPAAPTSPPPAPPSPRETRRRRLRKLLAGLGIFTAGGLSAYLFQPGENAANVEPTPTARLDPSLHDESFAESPGAGIASSAPSSFANAVVSRTAVDTSKSNATGADETYTLEVPVSDFIRTFVYSAEEYRAPLGYVPADYLNTDLTSDAYDEINTPPAGVEPLISDGVAKKRVRVIIKPDGSNPVMDRIISSVSNAGIEMYISSPNPKEHARNQHALCVMAALINACDFTIAAHLYDAPWEAMSRIFNPGEIAAQTLSEVVRIIEASTKQPNISTKKSIREILSDSTKPAPKFATAFAKEIIEMIPPDATIDDPADSDAYTSVTASKKAILGEKGAELDPILDKTFTILSDVFKKVANTTFPRIEEKITR